MGAFLPPNRLKIIYNSQNQIINRSPLQNSKAGDKQQQNGYTRWSRAGGSRLHHTQTQSEQEGEAAHRRRGRRSQSHHRRRRSHSRRRHSTDGKYRKESPRPPMPVARPPQYNSTPALVQKPLQRPNTHPQPLQRPNAPLQPQRRPQPQPQPQPQSQAQYPPDIKSGWPDEPARPPQQQDLTFPPTGWPAHWEQSRTGSAQRPEPSRGREERRSDSPHVRFGPSRHTPSVGSSSRTPPPSYRA